MKKSSRITLLIILALLILFTGTFALYVISFAEFIPAGLQRTFERLAPGIFLLLALLYYIKLILIAKNSGQTGQIISRGKEIRNYVICFFFIFLAIFPIVAIEFYQQTF